MILKTNIIKSRIIISTLTFKNNHILMIIVINTKCYLFFHNHLPCNISPKTIKKSLLYYYYINYWITVKNYTLHPSTCCSFETFISITFVYIYMILSLCVNIQFVSLIQSGRNDEKYMLLTCTKNIHLFCRLCYYFFFLSHQIIALYTHVWVYCEIYCNAHNVHVKRIT